MAISRREGPYNKAFARGGHSSLQAMIIVISGKVLYREKKTEAIRFQRRYSNQLLVTA